MAEDIVSFHNERERKDSCRFHFDYYILALPRALCSCLFFRIRIRNPLMSRRRGYLFVGITQILRHGLPQKADGGRVLAQTFGADPDKTDRHKNL